MAYKDVILGTENLAAYWRLGEASGTTAFDSGANALNLTYTASPTLGTTGLLTTDPNTCVDFNGTTQYAVRSPHAALQGGSALTVECWVVIDTIGNRCAVGLFGSGTAKGYWLNLSNPMEFWVSNDGSTQIAATAGSATATGTRYHVVGTYDGETSLIYINGALSGTSTTPTGSIFNVATASSFAIGRLGALSSDYADARIDDVAVYNRALSASEILTHYNAGLIGYRPESSTPAPSDVIIGRPGWFDQIIVPITPPDMAWRTDGPGSFECQIDNNVLARYGLNVSGRTSPLKGKWLWWEHPTAGAWGGVITRCDVGTWMTSVTAEQFAVLLRKRRLSGNFGAMSLAPGSLALMFLSSAERNGDSYFLTGQTAQECAPAVDIEPRGGDLCDDVLPELADFGYQWRVKAETMDQRLFEFRNRLGTDKSRRVLLSEGRSIPHGGFSMASDLWTVANSIVGIGGDDSWTKSAGYQLDNDGSIRTLGRRYEETIAYSGFATRSTIVPLVKKDLARKAYPTEIAEVQIVDQDFIWSEFREGDIVGVASQAANVYAPMEVDIRSLSMSSGLMTIAGRIQSENAF